MTASSSTSSRPPPGSPPDVPSEDTTSAADAAADANAAPSSSAAAGEVEAAAADESTSSSSSSHRRRRHPRDWLRTLLLRHVPPSPPASSASSVDGSSLPLPAYTDPSLRGRALAVAPMVDQSDLPFRLLCRKYGSNICWTPMIHAKLFCTNIRYREKFFNFGRAPWAPWSSPDGKAGNAPGMPPGDRPLIAQFCGSDPKYLLSAMVDVAPYVDGVDINCGCPQGIAKRGNYGAFLLEQTDLIVDLVEYLSPKVDVPLSVKVRLLPPQMGGIEASLDLYERLVDAGASMITVHGRDRHSKGPDTGPADWDAIRRVVDRIGTKVPVLANGGISNLDDVRACLLHTGCDGVMSSEAVLEYPPVFTESGTAKVDGRRVGPGRLDLAREYLNLAGRYPPNQGGQGSGMKCVRVHIHRFLHDELQSQPELRVGVMRNDNTVDDLEKILDTIEEDRSSPSHRRGSSSDGEGKEDYKVEEERLEWYVRHRGLNEERCREKRRRERLGYGRKTTASVDGGPDDDGGDEDDDEDDDSAAAGCLDAGALFGGNDDDAEGDY